MKVTSPLLPPLGELIPALEEIWKNEWLTNNGAFHKRLEKELCAFLGVEHISLFANGTLPLITALQALESEGEVITTPYTFVATSHSIYWNHLTPVFADVESEYGNIDPEAVERAITPRTSAIMAVHVYGNPCDTERLGEIARRHGLSLIYDAAHAFGVKRNGASILLEGDVSTLSFHATKTFTTAEGGAMVCSDKELKQKVDYLKNFGFAGETEVIMPGINSKMDEIRSALGLRCLPLVMEATARRKELTHLYREALGDVEGIRIQKDMPGVEHNYGYFPIFVEAGYGRGRDELYEELRRHDIFGRRYFYPLISDFEPYRSLPSARRVNLPVARRLASEVICLPMHHMLGEGDVGKVADTIKTFRK